MNVKILIMMMMMMMTMMMTESAKVNNADESIANSENKQPEELTIHNTRNFDDDTEKYTENDVILQENSSNETKMDDNIKEMENINGEINSESMESHSEETLDHNSKETSDQNSEKTSDHNSKETSSINNEGTKQKSSENNEENMENSTKNRKESSNQNSEEKSSKNKAENLVRSTEHHIEPSNQNSEATSSKNKLNADQNSEENQINNSTRSTRTSNTNEDRGRVRKGGIVLISLGCGEDEAMMSGIARVLSEYGHSISVIVYGERRSKYPSTVEVLEIPIDAEDPLFDNGSRQPLTPEDTSGSEWSIPSPIIRSRVSACREMQKNTLVAETMRSAKLIVTPLFLHDLCVLGLGGALKVPVVGVVTSRVGAWWVWDQLDVLPPLSTHAVPPYTLEEFGVWSRLANLARHYGYLSSIRQAWQVPASTALAAAPKHTLSHLYMGLAGVLVAWDPILDPTLPNHPAIVPVGAINLQPGTMEKDVLVPALINRVGVVTVSVFNDEIWVGSHTNTLLHKALGSTSYTVLWRQEEPSQETRQDLRPEESKQKHSAKFVYKPDLPLSDILNHPRHRLLISSCSESDVMGGVYFGCPMLCLPVTADQHLAAVRLQKLGLGVMIGASDVTLDKLKAAIHTLTSDRKYREKGRQLGEELHDQAMSPDDRLLFTLERVIRKPHSHLLVRERKNHLSLLQKGNADIYLLLLLLLTFIIALFIYILIALLPIIMAKNKHKKD